MLKIEWLYYIIMYIVSGILKRKDRMKKIINWFKNYFYYYKVHFIIGAIIVAIAGFTTYQICSREKFDYNVYLCVSEYTASGFRSSVKAAVSQYGEDLDGDGSVNVQIIDMSYNFSDPNSDEARSKAILLAGEMKSSSGFVFIYDDYYYEKAFTTMFEKHDGLEDKNGTAKDVEKLDLSKYIKYGLTEAGIDESTCPKMFISLRQEPDKTKDTHKTYENDKALFENIINNKLTQPAK